jgi:hypothetical protein
VSTADEIKANLDLYHEIRKLGFSFVDTIDSHPGAIVVAYQDGDSGRRIKVESTDLKWALKGVITLIKSQRLEKAA